MTKLAEHQKIGKIMFEDEVDESLSLSDRVLNFCARGSVTFAELGEAFPEHFNQEDDKAVMMMTRYENLALWAPISLEMVNVLKDAAVDGKLVMSATSSMIYLVDGCCPIPPVAKKLQDYKKLHWLPVVFDVAKDGK